MEYFMMFFVFLLGCSQESTSATNQAASKEAVVEQKTATNTAQPSEGVPEKQKSAKNTPELYKTQATNLVQAIEGTTSASEILTLADELTVTGLSLLPTMIQAHPECKEYLEAIRTVGPKLKDLPLEEIESGYHADGKLPKMPSPECYHGKDLVVHPATVAALAKSGLSTSESRESAKHEIIEVLSHLNAIDSKK